MKNLNRQDNNFLGDLNKSIYRNHGNLKGFFIPLSGLAPLHEQVPREVFATVGEITRTAIAPYRPEIRIIASGLLLSCRSLSPDEAELGTQGSTYVLMTTDREYGNVSFLPGVFLSRLY